MQKFVILALFILAIIIALFVWYSFPEEYKTSPYEHEHAILQLPAAHTNIILFIADGCGYNQILAADYYQHGAVGAQTYEKFPHTFAVSTYSSEGRGYDPQLASTEFNYIMDYATDSAAAATAMATGHKTCNGALGVDASGQRLESVLEHAEQLGLSTGVVTSVNFPHATPAGFIAHNESRNNYEAIAKEMILDSAADVIMGAGHPLYDNDNNSITENIDYSGVGGRSTWQALSSGRAGADANGDSTPDPWTLIQTRAQFQSLMTGETPQRVFGLAQVASTLQQSRRGDAHAAPFVVPFNEGVPTLAEMTAAALNLLDNNPRGFVVMIEGGAGDWACHDNMTGRFLEEQIAFNGAVAAAHLWVEQNSTWADTLIIVTGDHETGYLTGPGSNPEITPLVNNGPGQLPGLQWNSGSHTNSLIPVFAKGKGSDLLAKYADETDPIRGPYIDNTEIAKLVFEVLGGAASK